VPAGADDDVKTQLARIEGMLSATLPHHSARLDEHDRRIDDHDQRLRAVGSDVAVLKASSADRVDVAVQRATEERGRDDSRHRSATLWQAAAAVAGLLLVVATLVAVFKP